MKNGLVLGCAMALMGCISNNALQSWNGRDAGWLVWTMGESPQREEIIGPLKPGVENAMLVVDAIRAQIPEYEGELRHMQWTTLLHTYDAYLMLSNDTWIVVEALRHLR